MKMVGVMMVNSVFEDLISETTRSAFPVFDNTKFWLFDCPTTVSSKITKVTERTGLGSTVPVPIKLSFDVLPAALCEMVKDPVLSPAEVGVKVTVTI